MLKNENKKIVIGSNPLKMEGKNYKWKEKLFTGDLWTAAAGEVLVEFLKVKNSSIGYRKPTSAMDKRYVVKLLVMKRSTTF